MTEPIALSGAPGSPYTRKMLAVLRYRRIPYRFMLPTNPRLAELPRPKVSLLPTFYLPDEAGGLAAVTDSTPLIRRFEREYEGRGLIPSDPAIAFLNELIEDYADEWLTKAMFHYRWAYPADVAKAAVILPCWRGYCRSDDEMRAAADAIAERQIGRLRYVGSNGVTGPVIEASYKRFLTAFEDLLRGQPYLLGQRPSSCDFAVYGQLTQLAEFDPTPMALTLHVHQIQFVDQALAFQQADSAVDRHAVHLGIDSAGLAQNLSGIQMLLCGLDDAENGAALLGHADTALGDVE